MYKTAISRAFLSTPSNHGCVKSSAIYILLGRMTFAIPVLYYLRWRGGLVLAAGASHQMLCFLYFGDRWPPVAVHGVKGDAFQSGGRFVLLYIVAVSVFPPPQHGCLASFLALKGCIPFENPAIFTSLRSSQNGHQTITRSAVFVLR